MKKIFLESLIPFIIILPLMMFFLENKSKFGTVGLFFLIFVTHEILLKLPIEYQKFQIIHGKWNWSGKIFGTIFGVLVYVLLQKRLVPFDFCKIKQAPNSKRKTLFLSTMITFTALFSLFDNSLVFDSETLLYQILMPGFDEEIILRAVLLGLLLSCLKDKIKIGNKAFGSPSALIIGILFGLLHGLSITNEMKVGFDIYSFVWTMLLGYVWAWVAIQSKSILQPIISHNLLNFSSNLIRMIN